MVRNRLRVILAERNMSAAQFSREIGVHRTTIARFMDDDRRSINRDVLDAACEYLEVQPGDILVYSEDVEQS